MFFAEQKQTVTGITNAPRGRLTAVFRPICALTTTRAACTCSLCRRRGRPSGLCRGTRASTILRAQKTLEEVMQHFVVRLAPGTPRQHRWCCRRTRRATPDGCAERDTLCRRQSGSSNRARPTRRRTRTARTRKSTLHLVQRTLDVWHSERRTAERADDARRGSLCRVAEHAARIFVCAPCVLVVVLCEKGLFWDGVVEGRELSGLEWMSVQLLLIVL